MPSPTRKNASLTLTCTKAGQNRIIGFLTAQNVQYFNKSCIKYLKEITYTAYCTKLAYMFNEQFCNDFQTHCCHIFIYWLSLLLERHDVQEDNKHDQLLLVELPDQGADHAQLLLVCSAVPEGIWKLQFLAL